VRLTPVPNQIKWNVETSCLSVEPSVRTLFAVYCLDLRLSRVARLIRA
jgi:hypothetical protein